MPPPLGGQVQEDLDLYTCRAPHAPRKGARGGKKGARDQIFEMANKSKGIFVHQRILVVQEDLDLDL